jgi:hypothetical protein
MSAVSKVPWAVMSKWRLCPCFRGQECNIAAAGRGHTGVKSRRLGRSYQGILLSMFFLFIFSYMDHSFLALVFSIQRRARSAGISAKFCNDSQH